MCDRTPDDDRGLCRMASDRVESQSSWMRTSVRRRFGFVAAGIASARHTDQRRALRRTLTDWLRCPIPCGTDDPILLLVVPVHIAFCRTRTGRPTFISDPEAS